MDMLNGHVKFYFKSLSRLLEIDKKISKGLLFTRGSGGTGIYVTYEGRVRKK